MPQDDLPAVVVEAEVTFNFNDFHETCNFIIVVSAVHQISMLCYRFMVTREDMVIEKCMYINIK